jgi:hypothetical protein
MESLRVIHLLSMKTLKILLILSLIVSMGLSAGAQNTRKERKAAKEAAIKTNVDDKTYTFIADRAMPLGGGVRQLTSIYDLRITPDSVISFLPYFGRAYFDVGYNPDDQGLKFTSTKFGYEATPAKHGGWDITIKPKDVNHMQSLTLHLTQSGYGQLTVTTVNRDVISYEGYLKDAN